MLVQTECDIEQNDRDDDPHLAVEESVYFEIERWINVLITVYLFLLDDIG